MSNMDVQPQVQKLSSYVLELCVEAFMYLLLAVAIVCCVHKKVSLLQFISLDVYKAIL